MLHNERKIIENPKFQRKESQWWPGGWAPQGMPLTGGGGLARVPNLRVCEHLWDFWVAHAGGEG